MVPLLLISSLLASPVLLEATRLGEAAGTAANPIRKVVTMLQAMQKKVTEEGEVEKELYEKFMCYCKNNGGDLSSSIEAAEVKVPSLGSDITKAEEQKTQHEEDLNQAQDDRSAAKSSTTEATAIREKEAASFAAEKAEYDANIKAIQGAVAALEKGMGAGFLQTSDAQVLRALTAGKRSALVDEDREQVLAFLSSKDGSEYAPQSGQITGILKEMGDEMAKGLAEATATEQASIKSYEELMQSKKKEIGVLTAKVETRSSRIGELGVSIAQMKNDLTDTEEALMADKEFLGNLRKGCDTKTAEWEERVRTRADELVALADTIKVLNDDDALDLFKKTLPSASSSFVQVQDRSSAVQARTLAKIQRLLATRRGPERAQLDLLSLALRGKKIGFEKVIEMVDNMTLALKVEQQDDDQKKEYCAAQFDLSDDKKKALERKVADSESAIQSAEEGIASLKEEAEALTKGIKALDKQVAAATEQRKEEHKEFTELMASDSAAKELLGFAKNRLNQFYNPRLYKPPAKRELSAQDRIAVNLDGGTAPPTPAPGGIAGTGIAVLAQVNAHTQQRDVPPPPPETFGAYSKKSQETTGVIAMIDLLIKDLDKEMTEAETEEKDAQADYQAMMKDSAEKRVADSKTLTDKEATIADLQGDLEGHKDTKASTGKELMATLKYISSLHADCDWLLKYFDARKEARASEIEALGSAKAVLSGADFSLVQTGSRGSLRGRL